MTTHKKNEFIIAHPNFDPSNRGQGGGVRYLMNILDYFTEQGWYATIIGARAGLSIPTTMWKYIALSTESESAILGWGLYLVLLFLRLPFIRLSSDAVVVTHRIDCMLAFVFFKPRNPKILISPPPNQYLRANFPTLFKYFGWIYFLFERICVNGTDLVVTTDPRTKAYYIQRYPKVCLTECVPSPVDLSLFTPIPKSEARSILNWPMITPIVIFVGRLAPIKNLPLLIRAFAWVEDAIPNAELHIIGGGESEKILLRRLAKKHCTRVVFDGQIPPEKLVSYYAAADILVLSSFDEGSPTVVKESLACGTAVVSTDVGDASIVLSHDSDLGRIAPSNEEGLAQGLIDYLIERDESQFTRNKRHQAVKKYGLQETGTRFMGIFEGASRLRSKKR